MENIREILAHNLREYRRKNGLTQPKLAEKAGLSTHYLAMIELARKFPAADVLNRLAAALEIQPNELFSVAVSPERALEQMQQLIMENLDRSIENALDKAVKKRCANCPSAKKTAAKR